MLFFFPPVECFQFLTMQNAGRHGIYGFRFPICCLENTYSLNFVEAKEQEERTTSSLQPSAVCVKAEATAICNNASLG